VEDEQYGVHPMVNESLQKEHIMSCKWDCITLKLKQTLDVDDPRYLMALKNKMRKNRWNVEIFWTKLTAY